MEWFLSMVCQEIHPNGIKSGLKARSTEIIWIDSCREAITLICTSIIKLAERIDHVQNAQPTAYSDSVLEPKIPAVVRD
jgi:hypothetical protein